MGSIGDLPEFRMMQYIVGVFTLVVLAIAVLDNVTVKSFHVTAPEQGRAALLEWNIASVLGVTCVLDLGNGNQKQVDDCKGENKLFYTYREPGNYIVALSTYRTREPFDPAALPEPKNVVTDAVKIRGAR